MSIKPIGNMSTSVDAGAIKPIGDMSTSVDAGAAWLRLEFAVPVTS